jgi:hypothetical protein
MLMLRIMANNPGWTQSPAIVTKPGMEEAVMGPYLPRGEYTTKAAFEASGLKSSGWQSTVPSKTVRDR